MEGGDPNQEAILTFGERAVYGSIPQASGPALNLETRGGVLWAVQTDPSKVRNPNTAETDIMLPPAARAARVGGRAGIERRDGFRRGHAVGGHGRRRSARRQYH